ncbi:MAG: PhzF family phenazine biosynthesis protein [Gemmatimonadaceae bacterium]
MRYRYLTADIFTDKPFGGNQLAVFPDAVGLDDEQMFALAREFNFSETTFVFPPEKGGTRRVRIWTPGGEVPFAGHPTVGTAHVLAEIGEIPLEGERTAIVLEEEVGPVPVTIRASGGKAVFAQLSVAKLPEIGPPVPTRETLASILSLEAKDLVGGHFAPQSVSCGLPFLFVPVKDRDAVKRARIRMEQWERTLGNAWASMIFVFSRDPEREGSDIRARMYAPGISVPEDPATGSACAALGGYLGARDPRREGTLRWVVEQGFEMGRPSIIEVEADKNDGAITAVRVGGSSVMMGEGTIRVS